MGQINMEAKWVKRLVAGTVIATGLAASFVWGEQVGSNRVRIEITQAQTRQMVQENMKRWRNIRRGCFDMVAKQKPQDRVNCNDWANEKLRNELKLKGGEK